MCERSIFLMMFIYAASILSSQTGIGIGLYPTGTETGIGFRSNKNSLACVDARVGKAIFTSKEGTSSFISELSVVFRAVLLDKIRFHIGIGGRADWNIDRPNKYGAVMPIGVEGFPFAFQNAGIFFEAAPFFTHDLVKDYSSGLRTVAGFVFYFPTRTKNAEALNP